MNKIDQFVQLACIQMEEIFRNELREVIWNRDKEVVELRAMVMELMSDIARLKQRQDRDD